MIGDVGLSDDRGMWGWAMWGGGWLGDDRGCDGAERCYRDVWWLGDNR